MNVPDLLMSNGKYDIVPKLPLTLGYEVSGLITEVHEAAGKEGFCVGDRIVALNKEAYGGFSEECIVLSQDAWKLPDSISFRVAAALVDSYSTALIGLARRTHLKEGDHVLINAGVGGLGLAAVDVAANVYKAKVIAVCGTEDKATLIREKGAWSALKYQPDHILKTVQDVTKGKGVRVVFDAVGGEIFQNSVKSVSHEGSVILAGFAGRQVESVRLEDLIPSCCSLIGISLTKYRSSNLPAYRQIVQDAIDMCEQNLVMPSIQEDFDFDEINEAFQFMVDNKSTAKIVIDILDD